MTYYHFAELIHRQAAKYGNRTALKYRDEANGQRFHGSSLQRMCA